jgi:hypothetical protein
MHSAPNSIGAHTHKREKNHPERELRVHFHSFVDLSNQRPDSYRLLVEQKTTIYRPHKNGGLDLSAIDHWTLEVK